jgi:hypothetical protein
MNIPRVLSISFSFTIALAAIVVLCVNFYIPYHALVLVSVLVFSLTIMFLPQQVLRIIQYYNFELFCFNWASDPLPGEKNRGIDFYQNTNNFW